ncbi:hypothetical protein [Streptomyces scopuliridis]|uniref:hypothetical protein n=1 Tax=Streptomyces scopuliridis TaxID=452529 RepID=UPI00343D7359
MTIDKDFKRAARELAEREGISYTAARRRLAAGPGDDKVQEPPVLVPIVSVPCSEGCDGSGHLGAVCRVWRPADVKSGARWEVRRAAELPSGRADQIAERAEGPDARAYGRYPILNDAWLLALVYAMLSDRQPELLPDRARLRAAVEADDLAAVDTLMEPLDRAAARLTTKVPETWWGEVKPVLDAYADEVESNNGRDLATLSWQEIEARDAVGRLVGKWRTAWTPVRNYNGYWDPPGVMWNAVKGWLDARLVDRHGGYAPKSRVRLADDRPAFVYAVEWGEAGPPEAYRVRDLVPGRHGNAGRLVPSLTGDDELVSASECFPFE